MDVTMVHHPVNYWAVLVAGVAYWVLGAIWYAGPLFGNAWTKGIGKTKEQAKADSAPINWLWALLGSLVAAYGIARVMYFAGGNSVGFGIEVGLLVGVCFVFATLFVHDRMEKRPFWLTLVNSLYAIIGLGVVGLIIGAW